MDKVIYRSAGRTLVIGTRGAAERAAERAADLLGRALNMTLLTETALDWAEQGRSSAQRYRLLVGQVQRLSGYLGAFELQWRPQAQDSFAVPELATDQFDLVLDLRQTPAFSQHALPQGYFSVPPELPEMAVSSLTASRPTDLPSAVRQMRRLVGEFDKPKFFDYRQKLCAHSRNGIIGCSACIDVCSAAAISSDRRAQQVVVNPYLCVGCGTCSTVCPTGAMRFMYPSASHLGLKLKTLLTTYIDHGGQDAAVLLHSQEAGARLLVALDSAAARSGHEPDGLQGIPARVLPLPLWHSASSGLEVWLSALAYGASQVWVLMTGDEAPQYQDAVRSQMAVAQAVLHGLGYAGQHVRLLLVSQASALAALDQQLQVCAAQGVHQRASFAVQTDKRATLELALAHLIAQAPSARVARDAASGQGAAPADELVLPASGSPLGGLAIDKGRCTLCLSCVSACPAGALAGSPDAMQLRFTERACVQCGLCVQTCPEKAVSLLPRLNLSPQRTQPVVLVAAEPYGCVRCGQPFGTRKAVELMLDKLSKHPMFQGTALERLKMCGDCRVVDVHAGQAPRQ